MQRYLCAKCQGVFCGWAVIHKLKYKCPNCGGKLKKINPDKKKYRKYRKGEGFGKGQPKISRFRV